MPPRGGVPGMSAIRQVLNNEKIVYVLGVAEGGGNFLFLSERYKYDLPNAQLKEGMSPEDWFFR